MTSKTPCAFAAAELVIEPGANVTITTVYGRVPHEDLYYSSVVDVVAQMGYVDKKYKENNDLISKLTKKVCVVISKCCYI
jgi:hypothetical protein